MYFGMRTANRHGDQAMHFATHMQIDIYTAKLQ
jgi:hypothetical protein